MRDFSIKASAIKSVMRSWRAKGISPGDVMKLMFLYLGVERFLDPKTKTYPQKVINRIRKDNGYRSIPTMLELIEKSESFWIIRNVEDKAIMAFASKLLYKIEGKSVADGDSLYLNITSEDVHIYGSTSSINKENRQKRLGAPLPKLNNRLFYKKAIPDAETRISVYLYYLYKDMPRLNDLLRFLIAELYIRVGQDHVLVGKILDKYLKDRVEPVFARRKGIQNWSDRQIDGWLRSLHQPRYALVKASEAIRNWKEKYAQ